MLFPEGNQLRATYSAVRQTCRTRGGGQCLRDSQPCHTSKHPSWTIYYFILSMSPLFTPPSSSQSYHQHHSSPFVQRSPVPLPHGRLSMGEDKYVGIGCYRSHEGHRRGLGPRAAHLPFSLSPNLHFVLFCTIPGARHYGEPC